MTTIKEDEIVVLKRAIEMLQVAATYIERYDPENTIHYDEADCDGYCVAEDCVGASADLLWIKEQCEEELKDHG